MWQQEIQIAKTAAKTAGAILNSLFGQVRYTTKKSEKDLVSEADVQAEKSILEEIRRNFPQDNVLAEEAGRQEHGPAGRTWIIDPLDGTTNFVHGFPFFAVSIGLEVEEQMVVGVVYNPFFKELFEASEGGGAFLNQSPIHVSETKNLNEALLATGFPYNIREKEGPILDLFQKMIIRTQGVRRPGSASIDMCYVAAGRIDGFWEQDLNPWDTAAGTIIVKEAGGNVSTYEGGSYTPYKNTIIAANPHLHDQMVEVLGKA